MEPPSALLGSFLPPLVVALSPVGGGQAKPLGMPKFGSDCDLDDSNPKVGAQALDGSFDYRTFLCLHGSGGISLLDMVFPLSGFGALEEGSLRA